MITSIANIIVIIFTPAMLFIAIAALSKPKREMLIKVAKTIAAKAIFWIGLLAHFWSFFKAATSNEPINRLAMAYMSYLAFSSAVWVSMFSTMMVLGFIKNHYELSVKQLDLIQNIVDAGSSLPRQKKTEQGVTAEQLPSPNL